mmetsp:Transcript_16168/g.25098  ORF Transcript_16168/g.25098 Transcript_16168/m.25098 type:complete len:364 (-) Transcript_16168:136-1227(-)
MRHQRQKDDSNLDALDLSLQSQIRSLKDKAHSLIRDVSEVYPVLTEAEKTAEGHSKTVAGQDDMSTDGVRRSAARVESELKEQAAHPSEIDNFLSALEDLSLNPSSLKAQQDLNLGIQGADDQVLDLESKQSQDRNTLKADQKKEEKLEAQNMKLQKLLHASQEHLGVFEQQLKKHEQQIKEQASTLERLQMQTEVTQASSQHAQESAKTLRQRIISACNIEHAKSREPPKMKQPGTEKRAVARVVGRAPVVQSKPMQHKAQQSPERNVAQALSASPEANPKAAQSAVKKEQRAKAARQEALKRSAIKKALQAEAAPPIGISAEDRRVLRRDQHEGVRREEHEEERYASDLASSIIDTHTDEV